MALGQAAGVAAALAIDHQVKVQRVDISKMQSALINQKSTLIYFKDVPYTDPAFPVVQFMGLKGYLPEWNARLHDAVDDETLKQWSALSGYRLEAQVGRSTRLEVLTNLFKQIKP